MANSRKITSFSVFSSKLAKRFCPPSVSGISRWFNNLQLQYKIGWSFGLAISVAIIGVTTSLVVAESYLVEARADIEDSETEYRMLHDLKVNLLRMHLHQKGAILTLNDLPQWTEVHATFLEDREKFRAAWYSYKDKQGVVYGNTIYDKRERELIAALTVSYSVFAKDLDSLIEKLSQAELVRLSDAERRALQIELTRFNNQALRQDAYRFLSLVQELTDNANIQLKQAKATFDKAAIFRLQVIIVSSLTSLIIAVVLLFLLSRAISFSVKNAAATAEQVIETSNFDLQVPVTSSDEVGKLSAVLNRLITQVKQLLKQEQEKAESLKKALWEIQSTQSVLLQSEKMSALGQMVAGVAHEINNPVSFIHGNLEHIENYLQDFIHALQLYQQYSPGLPKSVLEEFQKLEVDFLIKDSADILRSMKLGTKRICEIVLSLRNFSRLDEAEIKLVDIHEGIDSTLVILAHRLKANSQRPEIEVIKNYGRLPKVECYAGQINQVFMNILSNAIDAFEEVNQNLTYQEIQANPNQICIYTEVRENDQVKICIKDNGPGIPEHIIDKLFNPFFTTKAVGKGTGLGLSISYRVVTEKHQGTLQCQSQLGQGTEFMIQIPICQLKLQAATSKATVLMH